MPTERAASIYDRLRPHLDAGDIIRRLGLDLRRTLGSEAYCRPLCHDSTSGESLQVNLHTGRWNCKACQMAGVFGDLFQLVEYALSHGQAPAHGDQQRTSDGHRAALEWLCQQYGVPFDAGRITGDPGLDVVHLFAMKAHEHLLRSPEVLAWVQEKWGFDRSTVEAYGIGFMPSPILAELVVESEHARSHAAFRQSGLGWYSREGTWHTRFAGRITFPYLEAGRAVYLIGRATPWTPNLDNGAPPPKYHKLSVHSTDRPWISERITNDHLYNEPVMSGATEVGVVEGVADDVAFSSLGFPVVSPVTISFNAADLERFLRKCHENGIRRVWILFDNELSGSGNHAARRTGRKLVEGGLGVSVLELPLGENQKQARDEVLGELGEDVFAELERADPIERKRIIERTVPADRIAWILRQIEESKIDGAEWCAQQGAGAAGKFDGIRKAGRDVVELDAAEVEVPATDDPLEKLDAFREVIALAAHQEERLYRERSAGVIATAAGKGITKAEVLSRMAQVRRDIVRPRRKAEGEARKEKKTAEELRAELILVPPSDLHVQPAAPPPIAVDAAPDAPPAPPPPGQQAEKSEHERYAAARDIVLRSVDAKLSEEELGQYVADTITTSMGWTPFRTPETLYLVRGSRRVDVEGRSEWPDLLWLASGLTRQKTSHRGYIAAALYFLSSRARRVEDVSWSFVDRDHGGAVYFPTGDEIGRLLRIEPGRVTSTRMAEAVVPTVAGRDFRPIEYSEANGGIARALDIFRWVSLSDGERMVLVYWLVCLPILRRVGTIPIIRIEGGSSSGKTRAVDAVSRLVNGQKSSSVPSAAALASRLSTEMLTVDDNRETADLSNAFLGTLLQATHLGAKEKRKANSDTGTVVERVCGALLMNGIEPVHDGRSEIASRMLCLRCSADYLRPDSPRGEEELEAALVEARGAFWSESVRRCATALQLDAEHGERLGAEIEEVFGSTRIGRLSAFLRIMYLAWVAGFEPERRQPFLAELAPEWRDVFGGLSGQSLSSLVAEELSVVALRYAFQYARAIAEPPYPGNTVRQAFDGGYVWDTDAGDSYLGPMRASRLARLVRLAGRELHAPRSVSTELRAGQLEQRILDGQAFLAEAGFEVDVETTRTGRRRFTFRRQDAPPARPDEVEDAFQVPKP